MGCSYDPTPYTVIPSPQDMWMTDNGFSAITVDMYHHVGSYCHDCGQILKGNKQGRKFLFLHLPVCPIKPREEVPQKTEEQCREFAYTAYH